MGKLTAATKDASKNIIPCRQDTATHTTPDTASHASAVLQYNTDKTDYTARLSQVKAILQPGHPC